MLDIHGSHDLHNRLLQIVSAHQLEDRRIRRHLQRAETILRRRDVSQMSRDAQDARTRNLNHLHDYWMRGRFPRNVDRRLSRVPCFIDNTGRTCAVADLVIRSGDPDLAHRVDQSAHNARIRDMHFDALNTWVEQSGLTVDELALIQPGYDPAAFLFWADVLFVPIIAIISVVSAYMIRFNRISLRQHRIGWRAIMPAIVSLIGVAVALWLMASFLNFTTHMALYFFGAITTDDLQAAGIGIMPNSYRIWPASQAQMARPLLIYVATQGVGLGVAVWSIVSSVRVFKMILQNKAVPIPVE